VALTSSFAGTGGIVDAEADAEAMFGVVACSGALFEGDFLRVRKPIFALAREMVVSGSRACRQVWLRCCVRGAEAMSRRAWDRRPMLCNREH
jgi:hypothetical protein